MAEKTKKQHTNTIYTYEETINKIVNHAEKLLKIIIGTEDHKVHFLHKALFIAEERRSDIFEKAGKAGIVLKIDNHFNNWKEK